MAWWRRKRPADERLRSVLGEATYAEYFGGATGGTGDAVAPRPQRRPVSGPDPVAAALAEAAAEGPLVSQVDDEDPTLENLPHYVHVTDDDRSAGLGTAVWFTDEIHLYADPVESGLEHVLAEQPGIDEVLFEDREEVLLRTDLALQDVRAAVIRAVVAVNRRPRPSPDDETH